VKIQNVSSVDLVYDDPVTGTRRTVVANTEDWCQPSANLPAVHLAILDPEDGYGKITRRVFVTVADVAADPIRYNPGCIGQVHHMDEFNGIGDSQSKQNRLFKRTRFEYSDTTNPTKWTLISETEQREP